MSIDRRKFLAGVAGMAGLGAGAQEKRSASGAPAPSPRPVTRGESTRQGFEGEQRSKIDWLNATFDGPDLTPRGFADMLSLYMGGRPVGLVERGGLFGFSTRLILSIYVGAVMAEIGSLAFGGESQRGRWLLQLTGRGCSMVTDWPALQAMLEDLGATLTRVDVAVDFLEGEYTVDDAVAMVESDGFTNGGRRPSTQVAGDWLDRVQGRTLYVGKAANGKTLRVYEKGRQLGDLDSDWVRYEVQFGNRDRVIPYDVLTCPDRFFAGAYPALESMIDSCSERIQTVSKEAETSLAHLLYHAKRCYGKVIHAIQAASGVSDTDLIEEIRINRVPRRVSPSSVVAGVSWSDVQASIRRKL